MNNNTAVSQSSLLSAFDIDSNSKVLSQLEISSPVLITERSRMFYLSNIELSLYKKSENSN